MSPQLIAQLVVALGPAAFDLIKQLIAVWSTPALTTDQVMTICATSQKSYNDYIAEAKKTVAAQ